MRAGGGGKEDKEKAKGVIVLVDFEEVRRQ